MRNSQCVYYLLECINAGKYISFVLLFILYGIGGSLCIMIHLRLMSSLFSDLAGLHRKLTLPLTRVHVVRSDVRFDPITCSRPTLWLFPDISPWPLLYSCPLMIFRSMWLKGNLPQCGKVPALAFSRELIIIQQIMCKTSTLKLADGRK